MGGWGGRRRLDGQAALRCMAVALERRGVSKFAHVCGPYSTAEACPPAPRAIPTSPRAGRPPGRAQAAYPCACWPAPRGRQFIETFTDFITEPSVNSPSASSSSRSSSPDRLSLSIRVLASAASACGAGRAGASGVGRHALAGRCAWPGSRAGAASRPAKRAGGGCTGSHAGAGGTGGGQDKEVDGRACWALGREGGKQRVWGILNGGRAATGAHLVVGGEAVVGLGLCRLHQLQGGGGRHGRGAGSRYLRGLILVPRVGPTRRVCLFVGAWVRVRGRA